MKRLVLIVISIFLLSGCVKNDITMKINCDKSMNLEINVLVNNQLKDSLSNRIDASKLENNGFKVTTNNYQDYSGYKITKDFTNIDELSNGSDEVLSISNILDEKFDYTKLFTKESSFLKDTYTANYSISFNEIENYYNLDNDEYDSNQIDEVELKYIVELPYKALSNNAKESSGDLKYLSWNLSFYGNTSINYSFEIYNIKNITIVGASSLFLLLLIIILIIILRKKKSSKSTLVYKENDVEADNNKKEEIGVQTVNNKNETTTNDQVVSNVSVDNTQMKVLDSLEFELPEESNSVKEEKNEELVIKPNTFDYHRRPDFIKQSGPSKFVDETTNFEADENK